MQRSKQHLYSITSPAVLLREPDRGFLSSAAIASKPYIVGASATNLLNSSGV
jgi:hypothetical protein